MKGILKKVELKEYKTQEGKKFKKVEFEVDVIIKDGMVKTLKGNYSETFARDYFSKAETKLKDLVGKEVGVVIAKKNFTGNDGLQHIYEYVKFINVLDKDGNPIVFKNETNEDIDF